MKYYAGHYEVAVIGAGHAGIEAGLAAARLGCKTAVFTISADWVGNMPCKDTSSGRSTPSAAKWPLRRTRTSSSPAC